MVRALHLATVVPGTTIVDLIGDDKEFSIGKTIKSIAKLEAEIKKCEVVCANCHAERTHNRLWGLT